MSSYNELNHCVKINILIIYLALSLNDRFEITSKANHFIKQFSTYPNYKKIREKLQALSFYSFIFIILFPMSIFVQPANSKIAEWL